MHAQRDTRNLNGLAHKEALVNPSAVFTVTPRECSSCPELPPSNFALLDLDPSRLKTSSAALFLFAVLITLVSRLKRFHCQPPLAKPMT